MSPNHEWIIYGALYGNRALFAISTPDGQRRVRLIDPEAAIYDPAWSGHRLALPPSSKDSE